MEQQLIFLFPPFCSSTQGYLGLYSDSLFSPVSQVGTQAAPLCLRSLLPALSRGQSLQPDIKEVWWLHGVSYSVNFLNLQILQYIGSQLCCTSDPLGSF